jgi:hypothetical protein
LFLACHRHHWMVHEGNWQLVRCEDRKILTVQPVVNFGPPSRGARLAGSGALS